MSKNRPVRLGRTFLLELGPNEDILQSVEAAVAEHGIKSAVFLSGIGWTAAIPTTPPRMKTANTWTTPCSGSTSPSPSPVCRALPKRDAATSMV